MDTIIRDKDQENQKPSRIRESKFPIIAIGIAVVVILASLQYSKGILVAATVNGSPISRLSVIGKLEEQAGQRCPLTYYFRAKKALT